MENKYYIYQTLLSLIPLITAAAQPPSSLPPSSAASPPPPNITNLLLKADEFIKFVGLLKSSQVADRLENQLDPTKTPNQGSWGLTIFAPNDNALSGLKPGALNSLSYDQMAKLVLFHCVPSFLSFSDLHTAVNPLRTEAGDVGPGQYPLNVTAVGTQVNFSTGADRDPVSVSSTIYSNSTEHLAIYEVNKLLAPMAVFPVSPFEDRAPALAPAPGPGSTTLEDKKKKKDDGGDEEGGAPVVDGGGSRGGGGSRSVRASTTGSVRYYHYYNYVVFGVWMILGCL